MHHAVMDLLIMYICHVVNTHTTQCYEENHIYICCYGWLRVDKNFNVFGVNLLEKDLLEPYSSSCPSYTGHLIDPCH